MRRFLVAIVSVCCAVFTTVQYVESGFSRTFGDGPPEGGPYTDVKTF